MVLALKLFDDLFFWMEKKTLKQDGEKPAAKDEPSVGNDPQEIGEDEPLVSFLKTKVASSKKPQYTKSSQKQSASLIAKIRGKAKLVEQAKPTLPGTTIHIIDEEEEDIEAINPQQYQKNC